jgi:hypothetical protein
MRRSTSCSEPVLWTCAHLKTIVNHVNHIGIEYYRQMGGIPVVHLKTTYDEGLTLNLVSLTLLLSTNVGFSSSLLLEDLDPNCHSFL